ncbi:MAG: hypothetical protein H7317_15310 [Pseudorhodobacter sp.]|nr:hypothetical protein [Pseudorhodobacter sp.]
MKLPAIACLLLIACSPQPEAPPKATAMIAVSTGGMLGQSGTQIYGDDRVVTTSFDYGRPAKPSEQGIPGAFARAAAVIRAEGPATKAQYQPPPQICMDYGNDIVQATPPIAGFDQVSASCPDDAVLALLAHVQAAIAP